MINEYLKTSAYSMNDNNNIFIIMQFDLWSIVCYASAYNYNVNTGVYIAFIMHANLLQYCNVIRIICQAVVIIYLRIM